MNVKLKKKTLAGKTRCNTYFHSVLSDASFYLQKKPDRIGQVYKKAMFRQFTDRTYSERVLGPAWLGFLGPILRAEVDDVIIVHLKNFASRNYSIHPHGVFYKKEAEGKQLQTQEIVWPALCRGFPGFVANFSVTTPPSKLKREVNTQLRLN